MGRRSHEHGERGDGGGRGELAVQTGGVMDHSGSPFGLVAGVMR